jgi:ATP-dependent Clp protease protease subunit
MPNPQLRPQPPRLLQLIRDNVAHPRALEVKAEGDEATVYLYGVIDSYYGDIKAADFVKALAELTAPTIHLRINSPGGDVFDARAMATAIRGHKSKVIAHIDGWALSAATTIAIAAAEVEIADGSFFMIHQAWTFAYGNANDLIETADLLEKIDATLAADYGRKTKKSNEQIVQWMADTTWFNAQEAVDAGFADRVFKGAEPAADAAAANRWDLSCYPKAPKAAEKPPAAAADPEGTRLVAKRAELDRKLKLYQRT